MHWPEAWEPDSGAPGKTDTTVTIQQTWSVLVSLYSMLIASGSYAAPYKHSLPDTPNAFSLADHVHKHVL